MSRTITFHTAKANDMPFACAALWLVGKKFALTNGFTLARSRNEACAKWEKACIAKDARLLGATVLEISVQELAECEFAEEAGS